MSIEKPMQGHKLMQVISSVNRFFRVKPGSLVVNHFGIA
jgi:type I restriction enzyme R subunit